MNIPFTSGPSTCTVGLRSATQQHPLYSYEHAVRVCKRCAHDALHTTEIR